MMQQLPIQQPVVDAVVALIRKEVGRFGLRDVRVVPATDFDGEPAIFVHADYEAEGDPVDTKITSRLVSKVCDIVWNLGETRFPYLKHHFNEDQKIAGLS